jgi:hypothetical protein
MSNIFFYIFCMEKKYQLYVNFMKTINKSVSSSVKSYITVSNFTFGDGDEESPGTEIRSGENEVSWYNFANFLSSVIR